VIAHLVTAALWLIVGAAVGAGIRWGSVWLARRESLEPAFRARDVYGPPALAALLFAVLGGLTGPNLLPLVVRSLWVALLVQIIFFDFEHGLILDVVQLPAIVAGILLSPFTAPGTGFLNSLITAVALGVVFLILAFAGSAIFKADALGFGDVKLAALIGAILGWPGAGTAVIIGVFLAGLAGVVLILLRIRGLRQGLAYGPYLAAGTLIVLFEISAGAAQ
jgi:prepilin signal peptidase PulO-like enzyme (type II secretory pathway)